MAIYFAKKKKKKTFTMLEEEQNETKTLSQTHLSTLITSFGRCQGC